MGAVFGLMTLIGGLAILFGWNYVQSGRIEQEQDARSELLTSFRSAGRMFIRMGQVLFVIGLLGMALSALVSLVS